MWSNQLFPLLKLFRKVNWPLAAAEIPVIAHTCHIFHFGVKLLLSPETCHFNHSLPIFRYLAFQSTSHLEILGESPLGMEAILKLFSQLWAQNSFLSSSHCQLLSNKKWAFQAWRELLPRSTVNACERVGNYRFTAKLAPAPTKIHGMQEGCRNCFLVLRM